jgi:hypothetical protein
MAKGKTASQVPHSQIPAAPDRINAANQIAVSRNAGPSRFFINSPRRLREMGGLYQTAPVSPSATAFDASGPNKP